MFATIRSQFVSSLRKPINHRQITMGVTKQLIKEGNGTKPKAGDTITMEYTGNLQDANGGKGKQYVMPGS